MSKSTQSVWQRMLPAFTLMVFAPLIAEVLPGATRMSSMFVFPIEVLVWGGGAVLIREAVRKYRLGWVALFLMGLALAVAEEAIIQQTSLAPLVIQLKGQEYARAFGINYVYLLWALIYESVLVVVVPVYLCELIFLSRRRERWLANWAVVLLCVLFVLGSLLAWYSWTHIARTQVFHLPAYTPPMSYMLGALILIVGLIVVSFSAAARQAAQVSSPLAPPAPLWVGMTTAVASVLWYALCILAFGFAPQFPPLIAVLAALMLVAIGLSVVPRWAAHSNWSTAHGYAALVGAIVGSMAIGFVGFIGATPLDLYGKLVLNVLAALMIVWLGRTRLRATDTR